MKMIRFYLLVAMLIPFTTFAHAGSIHAVIVDPPITPNVYELDPGDTSIPSVDFNFGACSVGEKSELGSSSGANVGCFEIENFTGKTITGITISFTADPTIFGTNPTCGGLFANVSCTESGGLYVLAFSNGSVLNLADAVIGESLPVSDFTNVSVSTTITEPASTPEPSSLVLLGTGVFTAAGSVLRRRRGAVSGAPRG